MVNVSGVEASKRWSLKALNGAQQCFDIAAEAFYSSGRTAVRE